MAQRSFAGAHTALVTPFLPDRSVDWDGLKKNIEFQIAQGIRGILPTGTTGESPTLPWEDQNQVIDTAIRTAGGRCLVAAGTGSNSTEEALRASRHAAETGADGLLLVDCYYNGPSSLELRREYHGVIAEACPDCAVIPYVIPGRSGTALSPEDLAILADEHANVRAVKEATGNVDRMAVTRELVGDDFEILSGDDGITCQIMIDPRVRAQGVVSVMSNVAPAAVCRMVRAALDGETKRAEELHAELTPLFHVVTVSVQDERVLPDGKKRRVQDKFRNPLAIKALMNGLGLPAGPVRRPLGKLSPKGLEAVRHAVRTTWEGSPWILEPLAEAYGIDVEQRLGDDACWAGLTYEA